MVISCLDFFFILKSYKPLQSCCCPKKICPEGLNYPGRLAGISEGVHIRDRSRFFDQVGHQTTNASIENKHFFTK